MTLTWIYQLGSVAMMRERHLRFAIIPKLILIWRGTPC